MVFTHWLNVAPSTLYHNTITSKLARIIFENFMVMTTHSLKLLLGYTASGISKSGKRFITGRVDWFVINETRSYTCRSCRTLQPPNSCGPACQQFLELPYLSPNIYMYIVRTLLLAFIIQPLCICKK